jgi:lipid II:glycine glycyltransferase (peptidoglycan interpeptide bridge formation enzyme)
VIVPLADDETLIRQMHSAKRREIRKAERRGIEILDRSRIFDPGEQFHRLMRETAERNRFVINPASYYEMFLSIVGASAIQLFAMVDGSIVAGLIAARSTDQAIYMFGGSSTADRVPGATALLQYHAMRWARDQGCTTYDLWGIPTVDPPAITRPDQQPLRTIGEDMSGLYRFKVELGGEIVSLPPSFEIHYHPAISWMARNVRQIARNFPRP